MKKYQLVNMRNIAFKNLPYIFTWIIYYAWVIVFTTWWTASPVTDEVYGADIRVVLHSVNLLSSAFFVVILKRDWFHRAAITGGACLMVSSVLFLTVKEPGLQLAVIIIFGISLGLVNAGILTPFVFILNNTEKFYAVVGSNLLISILVLLQETELLNVTNGMLPSLIMLVVGLLPIIKFRRTDLLAAAPAKAYSVPKAKKIIYITVVLNCLYAVLCKGVGKMFVLIADSRTNINLSTVFYLGAILGCVIYFSIYWLFKNSNLITWNLTFGAFVIAMLLYITAENSDIMLIIFAMLLGIGSTIGMINMYYILGVIGKKYNSHNYVKVSVVIIGSVGGITGITLGKWAASYPEDIAVWVAVISVVVIVVMLMVSPALSKTYFKEDWADDSQKPEIDNERLYIFEPYKLSNRESEICKLFLEGYTMRQIAATLGISYATVNTYQTSLYRKLGINSKTELLLLFRDYIRKQP